MFHLTDAVLFYVMTGVKPTPVPYHGQWTMQKLPPKEKCPVQVPIPKFFQVVRRVHFIKETNFSVEVDDAITKHQMFPPGSSKAALVCFVDLVVARDSPKRFLSPLEPMLALPII